MPTNTALSRGLAVATTCAIVMGLAVSAPAAADPAPGTYGTLKVFGSDTTQDVMAGIADEVNAGEGSTLLANYLAVGSSTVQIDAEGTTAPRANGSSAGRDMLRVAIGQTASATIARQSGGSYSAGSEVIGKIQVARSSSGPGANQAANGVLAYVPFAKDALTMAVKDGSPLAVVPWYIGRGENTTSKPNLTAVYKGAVTHAYVAGTAGNYTYVGVGASASLPDGAPEGTQAYAIRPVMPQSGSGTRSYFQTDVLGMTADQFAAGILTSQISIGGTTYPVQEHDGTVMGLDETVIGPFSVGQWVAFYNEAPGVTDRRSGAVLLPLKATEAATSVVPTADAGAGKLKANTAFTAAVRNVYNIVPSRLLDDPSTDIHRTFNGPDSLVCSATAAIELYGFVTLGEGCGDDTIRAYAPTADNTSTITWEAPTAIQVGSTATVPVTVDSKIHRQGGVVRILAGSTLVGERVVAAHPSTATVTVDVPFSVTTEATSTQLSAVFIPTLPGVTGSATSAATVPVSTPTTSFISAKTTSTIGSTIPVVGWVAGAAGGVVQLWDGSTRLASYTLDAGELGYGFRFVAKKLRYDLVVKYVPPAGSNLQASQSAVRTVTVAKATPTITATAPTVTAGTRARVAVTVAGSGGVVPTGTVEVYRGTTKVGAGTLSGGRVTVTLALLPRGSYNLTVRYLGNTLFNRVSKTNVPLVVR